MAKKATRADEFPSERQLLKQLAAAPSVDVVGVLAASGVGGVWTHGDTQWTLLFSFAFWRFAGGDIHTRELIVRRLVPQKAIDRYRKLIKHDVVTRIRARVVENSVWGRPEALLVRVVGPDTSDAEMNAEVQRLLKPVRFKDKDFGTFTLDRRIDYFEANAIWNGHKVRLRLACDKPEEVKLALQAAYKLWRSQKSWQRKVSTYAVKELLPLKNGGWLGDDEMPFSAKQFQACMKLESITVSPDGRFDFKHDDGDLFFGHSIEICGSLTKGLSSAGIEG